MHFFFRLAVTSILLAAPLFAIADEEPGALEACRDLSLIGRKVMQYRQADKPMSEALTNTIERIQKYLEKFRVDTSSQAAGEKSEEMAAAMVMAAYKVMISTPPFQPGAITEFENEVFRGCYEEWTTDSEESLEIEQLRGSLARPAQDSVSEKPHR